MTGHASAGNSNLQSDTHAAMRSNDISTATTRKMAIYYFIWLAVPLILCLQLIGTREILEKAIEVKPYSVALKPSAYTAFERQEKITRILCFSDSNFFSPSEEDIIKKTKLSDVAIVQQAFEGASMFDYYCLFHRAATFRPDLVIVPINWRSFGSAWINSRMFFHPELSALVPFSSGVLSSRENPIRARGISPIKQLEYKIYLYSLYPSGIKIWLGDNMRSFLGISADTRTPPSSLIEGAGVAISSVLRQMDRERVSDAIEEKMDVGEVAGGGFGRSDADFQRLVRMYPMNVNDDNLMIIGLRALASVASQQRVKILFYIWPIDHEFLSDVGILDESALHQSKMRVKQATKKDCVYFLDLSGILQHSDFFDIHGHCKPEGYEKINAALVQQIAEILSEGKPD